MKKYIVPLSIILTISVLIHFTSCTFDNEEDLLKDYICDTTDVIYNDLTFIFSDICAECHNKDDTYRGGIETDTYESVKSSINTGLVLPAIKHEGDYNMPYQRAKLSDCNIKKIEAWINAGMPEN
jgi:hypothetical protein